MESASIKLFVDDIRREPKGWHRVRTVTEAIRVLATMNVEIVSLDHDIEVYCKKCFTQTFASETYEPIARYIALMNPRPEVQFHTANDWGYRNMCGILGKSTGDGSYRFYPEDFGEIEGEEEDRKET